MLIGSTESGRAVVQDVKFKEILYVIWIPLTQ
jgi:hypothetical protein